MATQTPERGTIMALPLIIFFITLAVAVGFITVSTLGDDTSGKTMMFLAGTILVMMSGMFIMIEGLEGEVIGFPENAAGEITIQRNTHTTASMPIYLLANFLFWGGFAGIGFATYNIYKTKQAAQAEEYRV